MDNGNGKLTYRQKRELIREKKADLELHRLESREKIERKLSESILMLDDGWYGADLFDRLRGRDANGTYWLPLSVASDRQHGANWPVWRTDQELSRHRQASRMLCAQNGYAQGLIRNLTNYIIGEGMQYKIVSKHLVDADRDTPGVQDPAMVQRHIDQCQKVLDKWLEVNRWNVASCSHDSTHPVSDSRETETFRRVIRDGEAYLRFFESDDGLLRVRFIEPEQIVNPPGVGYQDGWSFGVQHQVDPVEDVENRVAYHLQYISPDEAHRQKEWGEVVSASEVIAIMAPGTDSTVKRGFPMLSFGVLDALDRAAKLQRNASIGAAIRAATAEIWQHSFGTQSQISSLATSLRETTMENPRTGATENVERIHPGAIRRIPEGQQLVGHPPDQTNSFLAGVQGDLRLANSAFSAPEYWTGDASNGNYASLQESSAPTVLMGQVNQGHFIRAFQRAAWRALRYASETGHLDSDALRWVTVQVTGPKVLHRNEAEVANVNNVYLQNRIKSPQLVQQELGLDPEIEAANWEEWDQKFGGMGGMEDDLGGMLGQGISESLLEAWNKLDHPRDKRGRFIPRGSGEANAEAKKIIGEVLKSSPSARSPEQVEQVMQHLNNLSVKQLRELHREHGRKIPGKLRADLVEAVRGRMEGKGVEAKKSKNPWSDGMQPDHGVVYNAPTDALHVDPERFQFKLNVNKSGVTEELQGIKTFNPEFAGVVSVWQDPADGRTYVINGHHRHELASRTGHGELAVRYIKASSAKEARAVGALVNIAEGRGTPVDAAKFMRDMGVDAADLEEHGVSLKGRVAADAAVLTRLNDRIFDRLARGGFDESKAVAIAKHLGDHALQDQLVKLLDKREDEGKDLSLRIIEEMALEMAETPTTEKTEASLFGDITSEESLFVERNEIKGHVRGELAREVNDFLAVASRRRAERVSGAGNVLDTEANRKIAEESDRVRNVFNTLVNRRGDISDAINAAAADYSKAKTKRERDAIKRQALDSVKDAVFREAGVGRQAEQGGKGASVPGNEASPGAGPGSKGPENSGGRGPVSPGLSEVNRASPGPDHLLPSHKSHEVQAVPDDHVHKLAKAVKDGGGYVTMDQLQASSGLDRQQFLRAVQKARAVGALSLSAVEGSRSGDLGALKTHGVMDEPGGQLLGFASIKHGYQVN